VIRALDTNRDRIIEADEIANAAASLKTLLKSGSTSLSIPDLLGPPPRGPHGLGMEQSGTTGDDGPPPPPPDGQGGPGGDDNGPPPPPPLPPVIQALDTNHDGTIEADEIANAPQSLKTLLKSGSDSLTIPDLLGPPPPRPDGQGPPPPPEQSGTNGAQGAPPPPPPDGQGPPPPPQ